MSSFMMMARRRGVGVSSGATAVAFADDFSSGDLSKSSANFSWGGTYNTAVISGFSRAGYTGNCLRFNFGNSPGQVAEQRFFFGPTNDTTGATTRHHPEVWLRYYIYFPSGAESPSVGPKAENANASNNKFMRCYALPEPDYPRYGGSFYRGATYGMASVVAGDAGVGGQAGLYPGTGTVSEMTGSGAVAAGVLSDATRGQWLKIEWYCKRSTLGDVGVGNGNGVLTMWVNDVQQFSITNINSYEASPTGPVSGFDGGYLFGAQDAAWTNAGTYVYLDDFAYSTTGRVPNEGASTVTTPDWQTLRDFDSGVVGASAVGADAFSGSAGRSVYSTDYAYSGAQSVKMTVLAAEESAFQFGGIVDFPVPAYQGDVLWIRLKTYLPPGFLISTPTNGSLKYLRIRKKKIDLTHTGYFDFQFRDDGSATRYRMIQEGIGADWITLGPASDAPRGVWLDHTLCIRLHAEAGQSRIRFWENGSLLVDTTAMATLVSATDQAFSFYLYTYWNGGSPQTQSAYADDIRIAKNGTPTWATGLEGV